MSPGRHRCPPATSAVSYDPLCHALLWSHAIDTPSHPTVNPCIGHVHTQYGHVVPFVDGLPALHKARRAYTSPSDSMTPPPSVPPRIPFALNAPSHMRVRTAPSGSAPSPSDPHLLCT
eukprot:GGOE01055743.1.p3 GENE.GGOE01055743.1~~GGOE01055743.1.p3  ORF type:complete len:118 (-),score=2.00 GGOE01055743.1:174-527(-)